MKILVTGVGGFVGAHLARELQTAGHVVVGAGLGPAPAALDGVLADYLQGDLAVQWPGISVDAVVHLAALSAVGPSFADPQRYLHANSAPLTNLGERLLASREETRVVVVSTGAVYGSGDGDALTEDSPVVATSPYAVSKILTETQSAYYRRQGLDIVVMRPFNHIGPGQGSGFILPDLVTGALRWKESGTPLSVGNLDTRRDYTDVRDVVRAYRLAAESPRTPSPVLNVCTGTSVSGTDLLHLVADAMEIAVPEVLVDAARLRPDDPADIRGDNRLIRTALDWIPEIPIAQSVGDLVRSAHG